MDVFALFNVPSNSIESYELSFLGGFPPKELNPDGKRTVHELGIRPNESLIVKMSLSGDANEGKTAQNCDAKQPATKPAAAKEPATESESSTVSNSGRPKRASAMAATANFRDVIAAQDAILKKDKKIPKKKAGNIGGFGNSSKRIVAIGASDNKRPKKAKMEGDGYRLSDGKSFAGSQSKKKSGGKQQQKPLFDSKDDVAGTLLSSLGGSGKGGNIGRFLRMAMKGAVAKSYEASRAAVRVTAVNQGDFSFEKVKGGSVVDGGGVVLGTANDHEPQNDDNETADVETLERTLYTVAYSKGMEGRGRYEEQVEIIGLAALKGVLESVYNTESSNDPDENDGDENTDGKEMLRPVAIAQMSPRVFWSLVYHCSEAAKKDQIPTQPSVEDLLQSTMPHLDWTYLDRGGRKRQLSEKARENLKQKRVGTVAQPKSKSSSQAEEEGVKAIEEMEESIMNAIMPNEGDDDQELNERERRAKAAMARFGSVQDANASPASSPAKNGTVDDWMLVTPIEDDIDELIECMMEGASSEGDDSSRENFDEETAKAWAGTLLGSVRNWRELANSNPEYILSKLKPTDENPHVPATDTIDKWIDAAQARAMEEIMLEILDGDQDALELLQEKALSSSPRDLSNWHSAPGMLLDAISGTEVSSEKWEKSDVVRWIHRAKTALGVCTWLEFFTTS